MPGLGVLQIVLGTGQSNSVGSSQNAITLTASPVNLMLAPLPLEAGETGSIDGTCAPEDRPTAPSDYTSLVPLQQESRMRYVSSYDYTTGLPIAPTVLGLHGETPFPALCQYLSAIYPSARYAGAIAGLGGAEYQRIQGRPVISYMFNNGRSMISAIQTLALTAGYDSVIVKMILMQHGEGDNGSLIYATYMQQFIADWTAAIKVITGQTYNPYLVQIQINDTASHNSSLAQIDVTHQNPLIAVALPSYFLPEANATHRSAIGQRTSGSYWGRYYDRVIMQGLPQRLLEIKSAIRIGRKIYITYYPTFVPPLQFLTTAVVSQQTNQGFAHSSVAITNVSIVAGLTVVLDLATLPGGGPETITYAVNALGMGNLADSDSDLGINGETLTNWATLNSTPVTVQSAGNPFLHF